MPNWVSNVIRFDCSDERLEAVKSAICGRDGEGRHVVFDFNRLIPMPKTLDCPNGSGNAVNEAAVRLLAGDDNGRLGVISAYAKMRHIGIDPFGTLPVPVIEMVRTLVEEGKVDLGQGAALVYNRRVHGYPTWYEWCPEKWGTKWNACESKWDGDRLTFDTAWSSPTPIIGALHKAFRDVRFEHWYSDEDVHGDNHGQHLCGPGEDFTHCEPRNEQARMAIVHECWGDEMCVMRDGKWEWATVDE